MTDLDDSSRDEIDDLRAAFLEPPSEEVATAHLKAMTEAIDRPRSTVASLERRKRRVVIASAAAGVGVAVVLTGGLAAAAGSLPGPLQGAVARVAEPFGIDLPRTSPASDPDADSDQAPETPTPPADTGPTMSQGGAPAGAADPSSGAGHDGATVPPPSTATPSGGAGKPGSTGQSGAGSPTAPTVSNRPEEPPGQTADHGNKPVVPPGQTGDEGNRPVVPPGQAK